MNGLKYLGEELRKIEKNGKSFMGMDGGNINSDTWFCGVEFGSDYEQMSNYYENYVKFYDLIDLKIPFRIDCPELFLKSTYDRYLAAMYINLFKEEKLTNPINTNLIEKVLKEELYNKNSNIFKLNLFPIAKKDIGWNKRIESETGITKDKYYESLFRNRADFFKELIQRFEPKLIICTSPKDYKDFFIEAFFSQKQKINHSWEYHATDLQKKFKISLFESGKTKIVIIPFLGRGNLSSYNDVISMTNHLKKEYL
jgi:hypothetical protein